PLTVEYVGGVTGGAQIEAVGVIAGAHGAQWLGDGHAELLAAPGFGVIVAKGKERRRAAVAIVDVFSPVQAEHAKHVAPAPGGGMDRMHGLGVRAWLAFEQPLGRGAPLRAEQEFIAGV